MIFIYDKWIIFFRFNKLLKEWVFLDRRWSGDVFVNWILCVPISKGNLLRRKIDSTTGQHRFIYRSRLSLAIFAMPCILAFFFVNFGSILTNLSNYFYAFVAETQINSKQGISGKSLKIKLYPPLPPLFFIICHYLHYSGQCWKNIFFLNFYFHLICQLLDCFVWVSHKVTLINMMN